MFEVWRCLETDQVLLADVGLASVLSDADYISQVRGTGTFAYAGKQILRLISWSTNLQMTATSKSV